MNDGKYRIMISPDDFQDGNCFHFSGVGNMASAVSVDCPNCHMKMFPAFNLNCKTLEMKKVVSWKQEYLHVLFCPSCFLYMEPYWIQHTEKAVTIFGGVRDGGEIVHNITRPFKARQISLYDLDTLSDNTDIPPHQLGGQKPNPKIPALICTLCSQPMKFFGILAYDDLNVPLYENGDSPVSLIIGDYDVMYMDVCENCQCVGLQWVW